MTVGLEFSEEETEIDDCVVGEDEYSGLFLAAMEGDLQMVKFAYQYGADVNSVTKSGRTPLMEAALWGTNADVVKFLLDCNAKKDMRGRRGQRAIDLAQETIR